MELSDNISVIKGIGIKKAEALKKLNIETVEELLHLFPRKYEDRRHPAKIRETVSNQDYLICGKVVSKSSKGNPYRKNTPLTLIVDDGEDQMQVVFFNGKYIVNFFNINQVYSFYGKVRDNFGIKQMVHPEFHKLNDPGDVRGIVPVYPLVNGISQGELRKWQRQIAPMAEGLDEWLGEEIVAENNLCSPSYAFSNIHFPKEKKQVLQSKFRLIFEELLILETGLFYIKNEEKTYDKGIRIFSDKTEEFINELPFKLTEGQKKVWNDIKYELDSDKAMNRLIQGDVGSGKTVIAEMAMFAASKSGFQSVMMAPTELLAKQHYKSLKNDFDRYGINVGLLCSSMKASQKKETLEAVAEGAIDILVGTHAVIQPNVKFTNLAMVVTDEQHRFGVRQRSVLSQKGENPNVIVMTATPIPRTLAVVIYGDLDISIIDTMPVGRKPILTMQSNKMGRSKVYQQVKEQVEEKKQVYVVAPLIEDSETIDAKSAEQLFEELSKKFSNNTVGLVHGSMKQNEKDSIMDNFANGKIDILVSTVVIEVGINVPNATVMVIENCERFGLAQLHQLRGRVGRGSDQSYCFLICENESQLAEKRNKIMCSSNDGFEIAEADMRLRGPGEIFGTRQHGLPEMHISDLMRHGDILEKAKKQAQHIIEMDPGLCKAENIKLKDKVKKMFGDKIRLEL